MKVRERRFCVAVAQAKVVCCFVGCVGTLSGKGGMVGWQVVGGRRIGRELSVKVSFGSWVMYHATCSEQIHVFLRKLFYLLLHI